MIGQTGSYSQPTWLKRCRHIVLLLLAWSLPTSFFGMQAAMILGIVLIIIWTLLESGANLQATPLDRPILILLIAIGLSLLLAPEGITSFHTATSWWVLVAFYVTWFMFDDEATLTKALWGILALGAAVSWLGVYQSQSGNYPLSALLHPNLKTALREVPSTTGQYGAIGLFYSRITFAHVLLFPFCWALSLALEPFSWKRRLVLIALTVSLGMGLVMSWTRATLIVAAAAVLVLFLMHWRADWTRKMAALVIFLVMTCATFYLVPQNLARLKGSFSGGNDWGRLTIWQTALDCASANPVTGIGWGNFSRVSVPLIDKRLAIMGTDTFPALHDWAHSNLLTLLSETGIIGAFAFCYLLAAYFRASRKTLAQLSEQRLLLRGFVRGAMVSVLCFLAAGLVHDTFIHAEGVIMFWFTLAASLAVARISQNTSP
jgi:O-antigen ligase